MLEPHWGVPSPVVIVADHSPVVSAVTLTILISIARHFLVARQRGGEVVRMKVLLCRYVIEADVGATFDWLSEIFNRSAVFCSRNYC